MIRNEQELKDHNTYLRWYYDVTPYLDVSNADMINELYNEYFGRYGFPEQPKTAKGKPKAFSKEQQKQQSEDLRKFLKENIMVKFNPQTAQASAGFPEGDAVVQIESAEYKTSSKGDPQIVIVLRGTGPQAALTNRYYITENAWSDKNIEQLLNSAFSCGAQIPPVDFQVNQQFVQILNAQKWKVFVNFKTGDNGYVNAKYFKVKRDDTPAATAPNPFDQQGQNPWGETQPVDPNVAQGNPFGRDEAPQPQPQFAQQPPVTNVNQGTLPFAENGQSQVPQGGWLQ